MTEHGSESENPVIDAPEPKTGGRPRSNRDWWPNQLNLQVLHQHSSLSNPLGEDYDYAEEFKKLDVEALKRALEQTQREQSMAAHEPEQAPRSSFSQLGARIEQILTLAEEEAADMVARAQEDADAVRAEGSATAMARKTEADRYNTTVRADADIEVQRLLSEAHRQAEETIDAAHRDATARREEAEALWEGHRAKAAQAAADFEVTLATRRERAEEDFAARTAAAEHQLETVERAAAQAHLQSEREVSEATARSRQMLDARIGR